MAHLFSSEPSPLRQSRVAEAEQHALFDLPPDWRQHWWGMPSFVQGDAEPAQRIVVNFRTLDDAKEFAERLGLRVTVNTDTLWYPPDLNSGKRIGWEYRDES